MAATPILIGSLTTNLSTNTTCAPRGNPADSQRMKLNFPTNVTYPLAGRLLIAAVAVAATQAVVWQLNHRTGLAAARAAEFNVAQLPLQLDEWSGAETELDPKVFQKVGALEMVNRSYENDKGRRAAVHVAAYPTAAALLPHPPELCYNTAGWTIQKDEWNTDGPQRRYRLMVVENGGARTAVAYWYQLGAEVVSNRDELRQVLQKLRLQGAGWPPLVKVMVQVQIEFSEADSQAVAEDLGAKIYDWVLNNS
jgi:EpsI family protein